MKIVIWWGRNKTFNCGKRRFIKEDFPGGKNE